VLISNKAFYSCATAVLLLDPEMTARDGLAGDDIARSGVVGGDVVEDDVTGSGEKDLSDISVEVSSLSENAIKKYFK